MSEEIEEQDVYFNFDRTLIISEEYIKENGIGTEGIDYRVYIPHILTCQDLYLDELLGQYLKNYLLSRYTLQTLSPVQEKLMAMLKMMILRRVEASVTDFLTYRLRAKGVQKGSSNDTAVGDKGEVQYTIKLLNEYAEKYRNYACEFLKQTDRVPQEAPFPRWEEGNCKDCGGSDNEGIIDMGVYFK